jgi:hydrogenase maturation protease
MADRGTGPRIAAALDPVVERLARTVLREGLLLYPYRPSALKNRLRWSFGALLPRRWCEIHGTGDRSTLRCELPVVGDDGTELCLRSWYLLPADDGAREHEMVLAELALGDLCAAARHALADLGPAARSSAAARRIGDGSYIVRIEVENLAEMAHPDTVDRDAALACALASVQVIGEISGGFFVSLTDPAPEQAALAAQCDNQGVWPVLCGNPNAPCMLAPPIVLGDFPLIAPESSGDFYDATEIDEMLALRVATLAPHEVAEMAADPRGRAVLAHGGDVAPELLAALHGRVSRGPAPIDVGTKVRLRPRSGADAFDLLLEGKRATVVAWEERLEGDGFAVVVLDDDPGRDLGIAGFHGHRFFYRPEELEPA